MINMEDYKQKYEEALDNFKKIKAANKDNKELVDFIEYEYPELKESEDERVRKTLIYIVKCACNKYGIKYYGEKIGEEKLLSWLEKQGEQKPEIKDDVLSRFAFYQYDDDTIYLSSLFVRESDRKRGYGSKILKAAEEVAKTFGIYKVCLKVERNTWMEEWYKKNGYEYLCSEGEYDWLEKRVEQNLVDNVEPKFKVGDWVVQENIGVYKITEICKSWYEVIDFKDHHYSISFVNEHMCHLWTIQNAKEGDVLYTSSTASNEVFIFKGLSKEGNIECYCSYDSEDKYCDGKYHFIGKPTFMTHPATKEKRDLLFQKMKEAGYEWDAEKKELRKIEQKSAWSEEDEKMFRSSRCYLNEYGNWLSSKNEEKSLSVYKACDWLKSLKERCTWKPSDEQMEAVRIAAEIGSANNSWAMDVLKSMYQDLKKLKGE